MWISRNYASKSSTAAAETGTVTIGGSGSLEAASTVHAREICHYAPYGYSAAVPTGEEILLINGSAGTVSAGIKMKDENLKSGEISISSAGGARIMLKKDGSVYINGVTFTKEGAVINADGEMIL